KQAATLEETAAAIEQLTEGVKSTADGAERANSFVEQTQSHAEEGGRTLAETVAAMEKIRSSSEQISQIIGVIDDIAFQTNLLALNAGVEAARAGDAGRSFSVVAGEVQALAQRSANAAKEIKELINMGSQNVETGVDVVARTGAALSEIERSVGDVSGLVAEITEATKDQSNRIEEINTAVLQLDQVTQQNAAMVEESSAASTQLEQEAQGLSDLTNQFVIEGEETSRPRGAKTEAARPRTMGAAALKVEPDQAQDDWEDF
ncbi:MAG: methyl-accepting chemotaxis protein, partial [Pseudomonadota bacterium]